MATRTITHHARVTFARHVADSVNESTYYVYVADPSALTGAVPSAEDEQDQLGGSERSVVAAKRVASDDVSLVLRNVPWVTNTTYDAYDDQRDLADLGFYAVVNAGAFYHAWKCLEAGPGASTQQPAVADVDAETNEVYETADGYRWKYMYTVGSADAEQFSTAEWFPAGVNAAARATAVDGAVDAVVVEFAGQGYSNWTTGVFRSGDLQVGNATTYGVSSNASASDVAGFYTGCLMYLSFGTGVGQSRRVVGYVVNSSGQFAVVNTAFTTAPGITTAWEIYPEVVIRGDGGQEVNAVARALVNSAAGNTVWRVEMLDRGAGYSWHSASVVANSLVGVVTAAEVRSVYSPPGGHGSDPADELLATGVAFNVELANTEGNTIPVDHTFRQVGILVDPLFTEVTVELTNAASGLYLSSEDAYAVDAPRLLSYGASAETANAVVLLANASDYVIEGDTLLLTSSSGLLRQLDEVVSVNSTAMVVNASSLWTDSNTAVRLASATLAGVVNSVPDGDHVLLDQVTAALEAGVLLVGSRSGASGTVGSASRGGVAKTLDTFVGATHLAGGVITGTFTVGEDVAAGPDASGILVGVESGGASHLYVSNAVGFSATSVVVGSVSGATMTADTMHPPEIEQRSGRVLFLENVAPVTRTSNTSEDLTLVMAF